MRAMVCHEISPDPGCLQLVESETPVPAAGQVRLRIRACGVNFPDLLMVQGKYQFKPPLPFAPGLEVAGEVAEVGPGVTDWKPGDRVIAGMRYGGFADEALVPAAALAAAPAGLDDAQACSYRAAYLTAHVALVRRGALQPGETLLVHAAAGGVGLAAVEVGKLLGATVIAAASSDAKLAVAREHGADHSLCYAEPDGQLRGFRQAVRDLTGGRGADVIYDPVGGDVFDESTHCIAPLGRLLVIGFTSGRIPALAANLALIKEFSLVGVRAGEYGRRDPVRGAQNTAAVDAWAAQGAIRPHVGARFPLERAADALRELAARRVMGRAVLVVG